MLTPTGMMEKAQKTVRYLKGHYRAIYETKEKIKSLLDELSQEYDIIYVLMCSDEMSEIIDIAVNEYKSKHNKANIIIIQSIVDIDVKNYKAPVLLHMIVSEDEANKDIINEVDLNEFRKINNVKVINLLEKL